MTPEQFDLDLGDGHWLRWSEYEGQRVGGIITHTKVDGQFCSGSIWIKGKIPPAFANVNRPQWDLTEGLNGPTLTPSFLCHCGDHGFIREGKWVRA